MERILCSPVDSMISISIFLLPSGGARGKTNLFGLETMDGGGEGLAATRGYRIDFDRSIRGRAPPREISRRTAFSPR